MIAPVSRPAVFEALASAPSFRTPLLWVSHVDESITGRSDALGVAFSISRSFGNAVERNRARRRLRQAFREATMASSPLRGAILVRCRRSVLSAPYTELVDAAQTCLDKASKVAASTPLASERPETEETSS